MESISEVRDRVGKGLGENVTDLLFRVSDYTKRSCILSWFFWIDWGELNKKKIISKKESSARKLISIYEVDWL